MFDDYWFTCGLSHAKSLNIFIVCFVDYDCDFRTALDPDQLDESSGSPLFTAASQTSLINTLPSSQSINISNYAPYSYHLLYTWRNNCLDTHTLKISGEITI